MSIPELAKEGPGSRCRTALAALLVCIAPSLCGAATINWQIEHRFKLFGSAADEKQFGADLNRLLLRASSSTRNGAGTPAARPGESAEFPDLVNLVPGAAGLPYGIAWEPVRLTYARGGKLLAAQAPSFRITASVEGAPGLAKARCEWKVNGAVVSGQTSCLGVALDIPPATLLEASIRAANAQGEYVEVAATSANADPRDVLVVSLGDSFASGEGNPLFNVRTGLNCPADADAAGNWCAQSPLWMDIRCHRSLISAPALAAWRYSRMYTD
ncbi:MAG TPA: hypothetical protein VH105_07520, partial [Burkholderiales bacterium]|nr:hypothetical protein [Burkholderiales bacterium]